MDLMEEHIPDMAAPAAASGVEAPDSGGSEAKGPSMSYSKELQESQRGNLKKALKDKQNVDVKFIVGPTQEEFAVSRFLFASISPIFSAMLYGSMYERTENIEIPLTDVDVAGFRSVVSYAYCNDPEITPNTLIPTRYICEKYRSTLFIFFPQKHKKRKHMRKQH